MDQTNYDLISQEYLINTPNTKKSVLEGQKISNMHAKCSSRELL